MNRRWKYRGIRLIIHDFAVSLSQKNTEALKGENDLKGGQRMK